MKKSIIYYLVILAHFILLFLVSILSDIVPFLDGIGGKIIMILLVCSLEFFSIFLNEKRTNIVSLITIIVFCLLFAILSLLSVKKINSIIFWIYSVIGAIVNALVYFKKKEGSTVVVITISFAFLISVLPVLRIETIKAFPFWIPSLIVCLVIFIPVLLYSMISYDKNKNLEHLICIPLLAIMGGFIITWMTLNTMNYCLDFSAPKEESFVIVDKKISSGARTVTSYDIKVENSNTSFTIAIDKNSYRNFEIGDNIILSKYSGAFNEAYYIYEG